MIDVAFIEQCAPQIAVQTIQRIIAVESAGETYAINVNGIGRVRIGSASEAVASAQRWIDQGYSVDLGLMQINSRHLNEMSLNVEQAFDPCTNLKAGAQILQAAYLKSAEVFGPGQRALQASFSTYNTGDPLRGFANGYVARLYGARVTRPTTQDAEAFSAPTSVFSSSWTKEPSHVP